ncbi:MAG TPA: glycosyltransferase [Candidatus Saccharimonadales bacterium]|nr:glycosyltransferase [Candidatus Saccharimonadales bacterium]
MISVVIPAFNEEKTIGKCIESLIYQTTNEKYEVIVVDNASTDKTYQIASKYKKRLDLKLIKEPKKGRGAARFAGFRKATGAIILSLDGDSIAPKNWIEKLIKPLADPKIVAVTGTGRVENSTIRINKTFNVLQPVSMFGYRLLFRHFWLTGFNFAIQADIYKKAGGFNPEVGSYEDTDLTFRVAKLGKIKFINLPVTVDGRRMKNGIIKGSIPYVTGFIKFNALHKPPYLSDIR